MESISLRISKIVSELFNGNVSKFAEKVGTNEANVRNYIKGTSPKYDFILSVYENIEINFEWFLTGKGEMFEKTVATGLAASSKKDEFIKQLEASKELYKKQYESLKSEIALRDLENKQKLDKITEIVETHLELFQTYKQLENAEAKVSTVKKK